MQNKEPDPERELKKFWLNAYILKICQITYNLSFSPILALKN